MTTRRHPLAYGAYATVLAFGLLFATGLLDDGRSTVFASMPHFWSMLWEWELVSGGLGALIALLSRPRMAPRWPDLADVLRFEGIGAFVGGVGMVTYAAMLVHVLGWQSYSWVLMGILGGGLLWRGFQSLFESAKVERLGALNEAAQVALAEVAKARAAQRNGIIMPPEDRAS